MEEDDARTRRRHDEQRGFAVQRGAWRRLGVISPVSCERSGCGFAADDQRERRQRLAHPHVVGQDASPRGRWFLVRDFIGQQTAVPRSSIGQQDRLPEAQ